MLGQMSSLKNSFKASASGCSRPAGPTRLGPMRTWRRLMTRRSNQVMYAMPISRAKMMISERMTADSRSATRRAPEGKSGVLLGDRGADGVQPLGHAGAQSVGQLGDDGPVGAGATGWRGAAFLLLDPAFQVGE